MTHNDKIWRGAYRQMPCHYCKGAGGTLDHIVPRSISGRDAEFNMVPCCLRCNGLKADDMPTCTCFKCTAAVNMFYWSQEQLDSKTEGR